jgi:transposase-like protein
VHQSQLRDWVKKFAEDPQYAFPGNGQMKPEQLEIARLKRTFDFFFGCIHFRVSAYLVAKRGQGQQHACNMVLEMPVEWAFLRY